MEAKREEKIFGGVGSSEPTLRKMREEWGTLKIICAAAKWGNPRAQSGVTVPQRQGLQRHNRG